MPSCRLSARPDRARRDRAAALRRISIVAVLAVGAAPLAPWPQARPASAASATLAAEADATVEAADPTDNDGAKVTLLVDGSPQREAYLRFSVPSGPVTRATLRLFVVDGSGDGPAVHPAPADWSETAITWENRPAPSAAAVVDAGPLPAGTWASFDVTALVGGPGPVAFRLVGESGDGTDFASREADEGRPELLVQTGSPSTTGPPTGPTGPTVVVAAADARVEEAHPVGNYGAADGSSALGAQGGGDPRIETYLRFDVGRLAGAVRRATLRLAVTNPTDRGPEVRPAGPGWTEAGITWDNRPGSAGGPVAEAGAVPAGWLELDVTALVRGEGAHHLVLVSGSKDSLRFRSREAGPDAAPRLVIDTGAATTTGPTATTQPPTTLPPTTLPPTTRPPGTTSTTRPPTTTTTRPPSPECGPDWGAADQIGKLASGQAEMSGLVASPVHHGWGWGVQDSGHIPALWSIRAGRDGVEAASFLVPGTSNSDWEDVAYSQGFAGVGIVSVLENVGNGYSGNRRIHQVKEPDPRVPGVAALLGTYQWAYPDTQYNTEALFTFNGRLAVIAKTSPSRVYQFTGPLSPLRVNRPEFVGTLAEGHNLSVAALSADERVLAVASHNKVYVYENRGEATDLAGLIDGPPVYGQALPSDNREGGSFFPYGSCDIVLVAESKNVWRLDER